MDAIDNNILQQLIAGFAEPMLVARVDSSDWPVVMSNPAFEFVGGGSPVEGKSIADVIEGLAGRELAVQVSEAIRSSDETSLPVTIRDQEYLLVLTPMSVHGNSDARYFAAYWRVGGSLSGDGDMQQALLRARRRIRDLSRDDPVTGLLNEAAFRDVLAHDWAVAARENASLALVCFTLDNFDAYREVFGRHGADTCIRRVGGAIKRFLQRASDVAARIGDDKLVVLSHSSEKPGVQEFAGRIADAVRELGLHHPRSETEKFVTVSYKVQHVRAGNRKKNAESFLKSVMK